MAGFHSEYSPSAIERLTTCPASHRASAGIPDTASPDAMLGTAAHELHQWCLETGLLASSRIGDIITVTENNQSFDFTVDTEMANAVQASVDRVGDYVFEYEVAGASVNLHVERRVSISLWTPIPHQSGSSDVIIEAGRTIHVVDYKHGQGVQVFANRNLQMVMYALGALYELWSDVYITEYEGPTDELSPFEFIEQCFDEIVLSIHQPRLNHFDTWRCTPSELLLMGEYVKRKLDLTRSDDPPYNPDEKACKFCRAQSTCPAILEKAYRMMSDAFDDLTDIKIDRADVPIFEFITDVKKLDLNKLVIAWLFEPVVTSWFKKIDTELEHLLLSGQQVPNMKLVAGRGSRDWRSEREAALFLLRQGVEKQSIYHNTMCSPAEAEKMLPGKLKREIAKLVVKKDGKPTLAHASDKRPAINLANDYFDDLE